MAQSLSGLHLDTTWNAAGARPTASLQVSWDGLTWTDETGRLLGFEVNHDLHTGRGIAHLGENRGSTMELTLDNGDGRYSRRNDASPLYAYIAGGLRGFSVRLSVGYYYGATPERLRQFTGWIEYPGEAESLAQNRISLNCLDNSFPLQETPLKTQMYADYRSDQVIEAFLTEAGYGGATTLDHGATVIPWAWADAENAWAQCQIVARSEGGVFYAAKGDDLRFERFTHWLENADSLSSQVSLVRNRVMGLAAQQSWRDCYSGVRAQWVPRSEGPEMALYEAHEAIAVRPGQTVAHEATFRYPAQTAYPPTADAGDFQAVNAGMRDLSGSLAVSATIYGSMAEVSFENTSTSQTIYVLNFRVRGIPLLAEEAQTVQEDSVLGLVEDKVFEVPVNDYVQTDEQARLQASFLRDVLQRPREILTWSGPCAPWLELGDRVDVTSAPQGIDGLECYIIGLKETWSRGALFTMTLDLLPVTDLYAAESYFTLGTSDWADVGSDYLFY